MAFKAMCSQTKAGSSHKLKVKKVLPISDTALNTQISTVQWFIEAMVKSVKQTMSKAEQSVEDPHLAMLA